NPSHPIISVDVSGIPHNNFGGRDAVDAHPIAAVTGLTEYLAGLDDLIEGLENSKATREELSDDIASEVTRSNAYTNNAVSVETTSRQNDTANIRANYLNKSATHPNGGTVVQNLDADTGFSATTTQTDTNTEFVLETNTQTSVPTIGGLVGKKATEQAIGSNRLLMVIDASGNIRTQLRKGKNIPAQAADIFNDDDLINKGEVIGLINSAISGGSGSDRGTVLNAFTSEQVWAISETPLLNAFGTGYAVGDVVFIQSPAPAEDQILKAWIIVTAISGGGAVSGFVLSSTGAFTEDITGTVNTFTDGGGSGCTLNIVTEQIQGVI
ncbi:hypothetical protein RDn1_326, partial [Candidatus Termititenax dinenymphae]